MPMVRWLQRNRPRRKKTAKNLLEPAEIDKMVRPQKMQYWQRALSGLLELAACTHLARSNYAPCIWGFGQRVLELRV